LKVGENQLEVEAEGVTRIVPLEDGELGSATADIEAWIILSHLATLRMAADSNDGSVTKRFDVHLLLTIGSYPGLLIDVGGRDKLLALETHGLPNGGEMICSNMGIVEPITFAIYLLLRREPKLANDFLLAALEAESLPLMLRIHTALQVLQLQSEEMQKLNDEIVIPAVEGLMDR
jgi:hypothetical protein